VPLSIVPAAAWDRYHLSSDHSWAHRPKPRGHRGLTVTVCRRRNSFQLPVAARSMLL